MTGLTETLPTGGPRRSGMRAVAVAFMACLLAACSGGGVAAGTGSETGVATNDAGSRAVYIINNNWHTSIVIRRDDPALLNRMPEVEDFPDAAYLEFGWGDSEYYPAERPSTRMALAAALRPTDTVIHVVGLRQAPHLAYPNDEVVALRLSPAEVDRLVAAIDGTFDRGDAVRARSIAKLPGRDDGFYPAHGRFHMFNTCNSWTVRMLSEAGLPVATTGVMTARQAMRRIRGLAEASAVRD